MKTPLLYVLIGDPFLCEEKRKEILSSLKTTCGPDLAVTLRHSPGLDLTALLAEARTLPFLSPAQVFCLLEAHRFTKADLEKWRVFFETPPAHTHFIFEGETLEKGHPFLEWGKNRGQVFFLKPEGRKIASDFIQRKLKQAGKKITREALGLLETRVGEMPAFLDSLLDQLVLSTGDRPEIDRPAVEALEEKLNRFEGFDLTEALAERNTPKALVILSELLETSGQDPISLIGLLHWQLRRLWQARQWLAEGMKEREIVSRLRIFPPRDTAFFRNLGRFSKENLEKILGELFDLDWRLKSGRAVGRYDLESWLVNSIG